MDPGFFFQKGHGLLWETKGRALTKWHLIQKPWTIILKNPNSLDMEYLIEMVWISSFLINSFKFESRGYSYML